MRHLNIDNYIGNSSYLKAVDLQGRRIDLTISNVELRELGDETKVVLEFEGKEKAMALNVTNGNIIAELLGSRDASTWVSYTITLRPDKTSYQGKTVDCVRVDYDLPGQKNGAIVENGALVKKAGSPTVDTSDVEPAF